MKLIELISYLNDSLYPVSGNIEVLRVICTGRHKSVPLVEYRETAEEPAEAAPNCKWMAGEEEQ